MEVKLDKKIEEFDYLLMFDLASRNTGVCLWNIKEHRPEKTFLLKVSHGVELPVGELDNLLQKLFFEDLGIDTDRIIVSKEAMPTQLRGGSSTVQTFVALSKSHAVLDLFTFKNNIAIYDYVGVYPASTHAYLKRVRGWDTKHPVEKTDIQDYVYETYGIKTESLDESDAVFLAQTLVDYKRNKDLAEEIKELKKHQKKLKASKTIEVYDKEIQRLEELKKVD